MSTFFAITGASGVGKTTIFNKILDNEHIHGIKFCTPAKVTTRPERKNDNQREIKSISEEKYQSHKNEARILIEFERYGYRYGILRPHNENDDVDWLQVASAKPVIDAKRTLSADISICVILLHAHPNVIEARRQSRDEHLSIFEKKMRHETIAQQPLNQADFLVEATSTPVDVYNSVIEIIHSVRNICRSDL